MISYYIIKRQINIKNKKNKKFLNQINNVRDQWGDSEK